MNTLLCTEDTRCKVCGFFRNAKPSSAMYRPEKVKGKTLKDVTPMRQRKFDELADIGLPLGTRVIVFDSRLYKDDVTTPSAQTRQPATVLRHYGEPLQHYSKDLHLGPYESLIDVQFDHDGRISKGHFTWGIELIHA